MKCPLFEKELKTTNYGDLLVYQECLEEGCGWYDQDNGQCGVLTIARGMWILNQLVTGIVNKMPHEAQFRR